MFLDYALKGLKTLSAGAFIAAGLWAYGNGPLFEQIYISFLAFITLLFIRNINMIGIILISAIIHFSSELIWHISSNSLAIKFIAYAFIGASLLLLRYEEKRKYIVGFVSLCLCAECYWLATGYTGPEIYFYLMLININLIERQLLFSRVFITESIAPEKSRSLDADFDLYNLNWMYVLIHIAVILEYLLRHVFGISVQVIYDLSSYAFHGLTAYGAWIIFAQGVKLIQNQRLHV